MRKYEIMTKYSLEKADREFVKDFTSAVVDGKYTCKNLRTGEICEHRFNKMDVGYRGNILAGCVAVVEIDEGEWGLFNPSTDSLFSARFPDSHFTLGDVFKIFPEEFTLLPTTFFRVKENVEACLDGIAEGIKHLCTYKGSTEEAEEYAKQIYDMVSGKIENEKKAIEIEDKEKTQIGEKAAADIKNLGGKL